MIQAQIRLGRIFGVEIGLHYSWLIIAVLIATSLAGHFSEAQSNWQAITIWTMAIMTALFFFVAIILHELSHAAVARLRGLPARSITLFALGGVAQIGKGCGSLLVRCVIIPALKIKLYSQLGEARRNDTKRRQPGCAEDLLVVLDRGRVEDVVKIDRDIQPSLLKPHNLCDAQIDLVEALAIERARLHDVHRRDGHT